MTSLTELLIILVVAAVGSIAGLVVWLIVPGLPLSWIVLAGAALSVLLLTDQTYKRLKIRFPPLRCPRNGCKNDGYQVSDWMRIEIEGQPRSGVMLKCLCCGQLLFYEGERITVLDDNQKALNRFRVVFPKFVGRWKVDSRESKPA